MFAILVESREARSGVPGNPIMTKEGQKFWVTEDPLDHWVEATSCRVDLKDDKIPARVKIFETKEKADEFGKRWKGHPWWCKPKSYEVIPVIPVYEQRFVGYERR